MSGETGLFATEWTARACAACYGAAVLVEVSGSRTGRRHSLCEGSALSQREGRLFRWLWTAACGLLAIHIALAFHFIHAWSHSAAVEHTARLTARVTGVNWGGGVWINYLTLTVWAVDVIAMWRMGPTTNRRRFLVVTHVWLAFMWINATAVFGPAWWKPLVAVYIALLIAVAVRSFRDRQRLR